MNDTARRSDPKGTPMPEYRPVHTPLEEIRAEMEDIIAEHRRMGREADARRVEGLLAEVDGIVREVEERMGPTAAHEYLNTQLAVRHGHHFACCSPDGDASDDAAGEEADGE